LKLWVYSLTKRNGNKIATNNTKEQTSCLQPN